MTRTLFGPGGVHLLCNDRRIAPLTVADSAATRRKGLLGTAGIVGALWLTRCPSVHMIGMRYAIDAAVLDKEGNVLATRTLRPWTRLTVPRPRARVTVEAAAGAFADWGVRPGDRLAIDPS